MSLAPRTGKVSGRRVPSARSEFARRCWLCVVPWLFTLHPRNAGAIHYYYLLSSVAVVGGRMLIDGVLISRVVVVI